MVENRVGEPLDPTPDFDCHLSKNVNVDMTTVTIQEAYESTQVLCTLLERMSCRWICVLMFAFQLNDLLLPDHASLDLCVTLLICHE